MNRTIQRLIIVAALMLTVSCVSYYDDFDRNGYHGSYTSPSYHYSYNSPIRVRGLSQNDFSMMDNHPGDYFNSQLWSGVGAISAYSMHNFATFMLR